MNKYQKITLAAINVVLVVITTYHAWINGDWSFTQNAWWFIVTMTLFNQISNYFCEVPEKRWALGKIVGAAIPLAITWYFGASYGYPRAFWLTILAMSAVAISILVLGTYFNHKINDMPLWIQRPYYKQWKRNMIKLAMPGQPTASLAFIIFLTIDLDKHFEAGGLPAARQAILDWFNDAIKN